MDAGPLQRYDTPGDQLPGDALQGVPAAIADAVVALSDLGSWVPLLPSTHLAAVVGLVGELAARADATVIALTLEAQASGVVETSDHPNVREWVNAAYADASVPLAASRAGAVADVVRVCRTTGSAGGGTSALAEAVTTAVLPVACAGVVAREYRALTRGVDASLWADGLGALVAHAAAGATARQVGELREILTVQYGPDEAEPGRAEERRRAGRDLTSFTRTRDGLYQARVTLDAVGHAVVAAALEAMSAPNPDHQNPATPSPATADPANGGEDGWAARATTEGASSWDERTPGQRRADALVQLCATLTALPTGTSVGVGAKAQVVITMAWSDLQGETGVAFTARDQPVSAADARMLACDARIIPAVLGSQGQPLDVGATARLATPAQITALRLRDKGCTFPGCDIPPNWTDAHHLTHWADGGPTDLDNLGLLCRRHHTVVHQKRYGATINPNPQAGQSHVIWHCTPGSYVTLLTHHAAA